MNISVDTDVPAPQVGRRRKRTIKVPPGIKAAIERYREAYKSVYGVPPEVEYDGAYIRIAGQSAGVKLNRLREMVKQLHWRAG